MSDQTTTMIDRLYLELSQFTRATTRREAEQAAEIAALRARICAVCGDTGELQDSQAWDCGQPNSECPYCPHKVDEYRKEIAALREELGTQAKVNIKLIQEITALRERIREAAAIIVEVSSYETSREANWTFHPAVRRALEEQP